MRFISAGRGPVIYYHPFRDPQRRIFIRSPGVICLTLTVTKVSLAVFTSICGKPYIFLCRRQPPAVLYLSQQLVSLAIYITKGFYCALLSSLSNQDIFLVKVFKAIFSFLSNFSYCSELIIFLIRSSSSLTGILMKSTILSISISNSNLGI